MKLQLSKSEIDIIHQAAAPLPQWDQTIFMAQSRGAAAAGARNRRRHRSQVRWRGAARAHALSDVTIVAPRQTSPIYIPATLRRIP